MRPQGMGLQPLA